MNIFRKAGFVFLLFGLGFETCGQAKYLIYFTDKTGTPFSIEKPEQFLTAKSIQRRQRQGINISSRDLPVSPLYTDSLKKLGFSVWYSSRWLNAAYIYANDTSAVTSVVAKLGFVKRIDFLWPETDTSKLKSSGGRIRKTDRFRIEQSDYGVSLNQASMICADEMQNEGFKGEGMTVAIMDGGFYKANTLYFFDTLFNNNAVLGTYDFVKNQKDVYSVSSDHGTMVLSCMAAYAKGSLIGTAYKARYYLFRTEDGDSEYPVEEANWLIAAERADSLGVDVINTSLGYKDFDNYKLSHSYKDLDGKTTIISRAANAAAAVGMICVISAGNSGSSSSNGYISAPADADSVLTVGSVDSQGKRSYFSSYGPTYDGRIKPDVMGQGSSAVLGSVNGTITSGSGTSFASPIVCGMVAGFWQSAPQLTNMQVMNVIRKSASQYATPDNLSGYGIPCFFKAQLITLGRSSVVLTDHYIFPNPFSYEILNLVLDNNQVGKRFDIEIYDAGIKNIFKQTIENAQVANSLSLNSMTLVPGLYFVRVSGNGYVKLVKLVKN